jgi:hypothetical protein
MENFVHAPTHKNLVGGGALFVALWLSMIALVLAGCDSAATSGSGPLDTGPKACVGVDRSHG